MIKNVDTCIGGGSKGAKTTDFAGILRFKLLFCQSVGANPPKLAENVYFGALHHPTTFHAKIFTGNFYWSTKAQSPLGG